MNTWLDVVRSLPCDVIERADEPYMERYFLVNSTSGDPNGHTARFHHLLTSDPDDPHDHPWHFTSLILDGHYLEHTVDGVFDRMPGDVVRHEASDLHRIELPDGPVWTLVVTGGFVRQWGFNTARGWLPWRDYLATNSRSMQSNTRS